MNRQMTCEMPDWEKISQLSGSEKRAALEKKLQKREPIKCFSDIKPGDHLVQKCSIGSIFYHHHFLCTGSMSNGEPTIIHYHNTIGGSSSGLSIPFVSAGSGRKLGVVSSIKEITLPHKDLVKSESELQKKGAEVERVVWPDELRRFPVEEVIKRARSRLGEAYYDLEANNCESFVMWCMCGINFSLQSASLWVAIPVEIIKSIIMMFFQGFKYLPKIVAESYAKRFGLSRLVNPLGSTAGFDSFSWCTVGLVIAIFLDCLGLRKYIFVAWDKWKNGIITRQEFVEKVIEEILVVLFCSVAAAAGFLYFQCWVPIPAVNGMVGLFLLAFSGHGIGKVVAFLFSERIATALVGLQSGSSRKSFRRVFPKKKF